MRALGLENTLNYSAARMMTNYLALYRQVLEGRSAAILDARGATD
jgi:hypothetical protein